jgi:hypothetical protein
MDDANTGPGKVPEIITGNEVISTSNCPHMKLTTTLRTMETAGITGI